jgi:hypothetical protein
MKNITLSIDDRVLAAVKQVAARQSTTVNAMVREYLTRLATQEDRQKRARQRLLELSDTSEGRMGDQKWERERLYDR